jgi:hypothetical protein
MKAADYKDPNDKKYVIGATSKLQGKYELAATMEAGGGNKQSLVVGTFAGIRTTAPSAAGTTGSGTTVLTIPSSAIGKFAVGDTLSGTTGSGIVLDISGDGTQLTMSNNTITGTTIQLAASETK